MSGDKKKITITETLKLLNSNREAIPLSERQELASGVSKIMAEGDRSEDIISIVKLLSDDPAPEVRREAAELLYFLPDVEFTKLAARMSADSNFFVRTATERAIERRRKSAGITDRARRNIDQVQALLNTIEKNHGKLAAERSQKLADKQVDVLVGETIHDIRNLLSPLRSSVSTLITHIASGKPDLKTCGENLTMMDKQLDYLEKFVEDMREYSQTSSRRRRREQISEVVNEAKSLALKNLRASGRAVDVVVSTPKNLNVPIVRHQIVIALNHLIKNAAESFDIFAGKRRKNRVEVRVQVKGGDLEFSVSDNGPGIHEDDLREYQKFNPGNSTKKDYGTGFGLPTAYRCAKAHDGTMTIVSKVGKGTTVTITIPIPEETE